MSVSGAPTPQRVAIVAPSTVEFDSRTYRIASALASRGHEVTVLARWAPGLPRDEVHPAGYRIIRVPVSSVDGLPLPRWARETIAGVRSRRTRRASAGTAAAGARAVSGGPGMDETPVPEPRGGGPLGRARRIASGARRLAAIGLTVRSQGRATRAIAPDVDLVHGMAYMGIPVALGVARRRGARIVYDARDIYVDAANLARLPRPLRAVLARAERGWAHAADRVVTVNRPYAEVMAERWSLPLPLIVMNCAYRFDPPDPPERRFHARLGLPADASVVLYHGGFSRDRGIEQLVDAIRDVPGAVLVLLGYGVLQGHLERLAADPARADPHLGARVRILPAVPPTDLLGWVASADVVAMPIQPTTLNHRLTTPNKILEALAAGVPVVASDLPGMAPIVAETGCGLVVDPTDPAAIAAALRAILGAPAEARQANWDRELAAAHGTYCWERQVELLLTEYGRLTGRPW
jgi:glycosyltransferase involved in cell wall biosynthesis